MGKRSDLSIPQRREVVLMLLRREEPAAKLARRFGVSEQTLYRWRDEFLAGGEAALANGRGGADPRDREIRELKKEVEGRDQVIGECWADSASAARYHEILITPLKANPLEVGAILVHELCHTAVGVKCGHRGKFGRVARAVGLDGKLTATVAGETLKARLHTLIRSIGPYPHARLVASNAPKTQTTRMLKVECEECGCVVRMTRKWLEEAGCPTCGCGGEMAEPVE